MIIYQYQCYLSLKKQLNSNIKSFFIKSEKPIFHFFDQNYRFKLVHSRLTIFQHRVKNTLGIDFTEFYQQQQKKMNKDAKLCWYVYNGTQKACNKAQVYFREHLNARQAAVSLILWTSNTIQTKLPPLSQSHLKSLCSQNVLLELLQQGNFECSLLFCQRQFNLRDIHSNEICFPGGKLDNEESDFEAVIRETMEEVNIDLRKQQTLYLGRLPNNIEIKDAPKTMRVCAHVFLISGQQPEITMNSSEIQDFKWVPISHFYDINDKLRVGKTTQSFAFFMIKSFFRNYPKIVDEIVKNYDHGLFMQIDVGMKNQFFGFSFIILAQLFNLVLILQEEGKEYFGDLRIICSSINYMELYFKENTFVGKLSNWYFSKLYKKFRVQQRMEVKKYLAKL